MSAGREDVGTTLTQRSGLLYEKHRVTYGELLKSFLTTSFTSSATGKKKTTWWRQTHFSATLIKQKEHKTIDGLLVTPLGC